MARRRGVATTEGSYGKLTTGGSKHNPLYSKRRGTKTRNKRRGKRH